jgi:DNA-binding response OmpR family regulator
LPSILLLSDRSPDDALPALLRLGADVKAEAPGPDALARIPDLSPDVVVADAAVEPRSVFDLLQVLAAAGSPVPVLAVLRPEAMTGFAWNEVADDFVSPDASEEEVRLRLTALASRRGEGGESAVRLGPVSVNVDTYQVTAGSRPLDLTYKEFELLRFLAERPGKVFSRSKLLQEVWGYDFYGGTRTVDVHVRRLRAKLGPEHEHLIETVRGVGYRASSSA